MHARLRQPRCATSAVHTSMQCIIKLARSVNKKQFMHIFFLFASSMGFIWDSYGICVEFLLDSNRIICGIFYKNPVGFSVRLTVRLCEISVGSSVRIMQDLVRLSLWDTYETK